MKKIVPLLILLLPILCFGSKLNINLSKNSLNLNNKDSILYKFYLPSPATTTIWFINIYGGEVIRYEAEKPRNKGWHEIKLLSDSLRKHYGNVSSGVYYAEITGKSGANLLFNYNSFQAPWGNTVAVENIEMDIKSGKITYGLSENCITKTRIGYPNGALVRTLSFGLPQSPGSHSEFWDGFEQSGKFSVKNMEGLTAQIIAYSIPQTAFIINNSKAPVKLKSKPVFPESHTKYALSSYAKKTWNDDFDVALDYRVAMTDGNMLSFSFGSQNDSFTKSFSPENEIYIQIDGAPPVENPNIAIPGDYSVAFVQLPKGKHFVLVNVVLPENRIAVGVKELKIDGGGE
jgi:hypothetical protein